ncbi:MAG: hypothetical protein A2664_02310 [Candidatus Taylorbacteria bacterium RIFCSPHIGHO2_01_FULL_46_22b]|uniref:Uncharacterized protein n=1 Tax=Candidatus Taylorbacteria bacterium RIFCSPHIGHO2_01_FULL_46_22b TaxID=1802301 RepID=A0A1G2M380_9BACT|nr:MAG: hypothetical protein A2664_02310 [Candidatus Taylorbacteria bacterium RIFCSPHIGHO2_01_FULL_46_22b]
MDYKIIISVISVALVFIGYGWYIRDILQKKTTPHAFTFLGWSLASSIAWALQVYGGAGVGAWITFWVTAVCIFIFFLSLKYGEKNITTLDVMFLLLALSSLFLWIVVDQPVWSVILVVLTDVLSFGPTLRKSWNKPHSETLFTWWVAAFRHGFGILALQKFNILTLLYPIAWTAANVLFCLILIVRRKQIKQVPLV